ncbi:MAG: hypothetical protein ACAH95_10145 [Fimbriimonas sp.]
MIALFALGSIVVIIIAVAVSAAQKRAAEARMAALAQIAAQEGLDYHPHGLAEQARGFWEGLFTSFSDTNVGRFLTRFDGFTPFGQGHSWSLSNLLVGREDNADWYVFDYLYKTTHSTGKSTTTVPHPTGVIAVRLPLSLPRLTMSPENVFSKIGNFLGMDELDFELEEFNKRYFVRCNDRKIAYDLLHPRMIDFLMQCPPRSWQIAGQYVVLTRNNYYDPEEIVELIEEVRKFISLIPKYVEQDRALPAMYATPLD